LLYLKNSIKAEPLTAPTRNWRFGASEKSLVVNQALILRLKIGGEIATFAKLQIKTRINNRLQKRLKSFSCIFIYPNFLFVVLIA
jgi:predicted component of viral defense system (DUF524 family)